MTTSPLKAAKRRRVLRPDHTRFDTFWVGLPGTRRFLCGILALLFSYTAGPAIADQSDPALDGLFEELQRAERRASAKRVEAEIWKIWQESNSQSINLLLARGMNAMDDGDYVAALSMFNHVVDLAPNFAEGWHRRARAYFLLSNADRALTDIEQALALEPRHFGALLGLTAVMFEKKEYDKAIAAYKQASDIHPFLGDENRNLDTFRDSFGEQGI